MNQSTEDSGEVVQTEALDDEIQVIASIYKFSSLGDRDRAVMCMNALARRHSIASQPSVERKTFSAERIAAASMETERLTRELDITNADHIVLWLDENKDNSPLGWLACRIIEAHEAHLNTLLGNPPKHKFWGAGEPDCPRGIRVGNGELHTLRCKVCADAIERGEHLTALATPDKDTPQ